eukprot:TRINITY_DN10323_c0_g1_i1.p1 TRINITY_DN10323_c0_g1~~TRINITY_DN10323_c0_g1_i1.p1  ORF type:complete len:711 (+),score=144.15 TRINITY_DN10323_c0_g1_i1:73-2205(+)
MAEKGSLHNQTDSPQSAAFLYPTAFVSKLWDIVNDTRNQESVGWGADGTTLRICDLSKFETKVLPTYFQHSKFISFVRQLNAYDFHKVSDTAQGIEFYHPSFRQGGFENIRTIQRKKTERRKSKTGGAADCDDSADGNDPPASAPTQEANRPQLTSQTKPNAESPQDTRSSAVSPPTQSQSSQENQPMSIGSSPVDVYYQQRSTQPSKGAHLTTPIANPRQSDDNTHSPAHQTVQELTRDKSPQLPAKATTPAQQSSQVPNHSPQQSQIKTPADRVHVSAQTQANLAQTPSPHFAQQEQGQSAVVDFRQYPLQHVTSLPMQYALQADFEPLLEIVNQNTGHTNLTAADVPHPRDSTNSSYRQPMAQATYYHPNADRSSRLEMQQNVAYAREQPSSTAPQVMSRPYIQQSGTPTHAPDTYKIYAQQAMQPPQYSPRAMASSLNTSHPEMLQQSPRGHFAQPSPRLSQLQSQDGLSRQSAQLSPHQILPIPPNFRQTVPNETTGVMQQGQAPVYQQLPPPPHASGRIVAHDNLVANYTKSTTPIQIQLLKGIYSEVQDLKAQMVNIHGEIRKIQEQNKETQDYLVSIFQQLFSPYQSSGSHSLLTLDPQYSYPMQSSQLPSSGSMRSNSSRMQSTYGQTDPSVGAMRPPPPNVHLTRFVHDAPIPRQGGGYYSTNSLMDEMMTSPPVSDAAFIGEHQLGRSNVPHNHHAGDY